MTLENKRVAIIDYGMGNVCSVAKALDKIGAPNEITSDIDTIVKASCVILPGVGFFGAGMERLRELKLVETLHTEIIEKKKPLLGICLGMQLLFERSEEGGDVPGLGFIHGEVKKFGFDDSTNLRIPHIGWNSVQGSNGIPLLKDVKPSSNFYFVHSYHVHLGEEVEAAYTPYGYDFVCAVQKGNICGTQFHPEKSQAKGIQVLKNFLQLSTGHNEC